MARLLSFQRYKQPLQHMCHGFVATALGHPFLYSERFCVIGIFSLNDQKNSFAIVFVWDYKITLIDLKITLTFVSFVLEICPHHLNFHTY